MGLVKAIVANDLPKPVKELSAITGAESVLIGTWDEPPFLSIKKYQAPVNSQNSAHHETFGRHEILRRDWL